MRRFGLLLCVAAFAAVFLLFRDDPSARQSGSIAPRGTPAFGNAPAPAPKHQEGAAAQDTPAVTTDALFQFVRPENAAELDRALPAPAREIRYVRINRGTIEAKSSPFWRKDGRFDFPVPNGGSLAVLIEQSEMLGANRFTSVGRVEGFPESRAVFAYNEGFLTGTVEIPDHAYALRPATEDATQLYEVDPALVPPCGGAIKPVIDPGVIAAAASAKQARLAEVTESTAALPGTAAAGTRQIAEVHLMMAYTQAVKTTLAGAARVAALQSEFDAAAAKANNELAASDIAARVKLVRIAETQYNEDASAPAEVQNDALEALTGTGDAKMDEIHALRDQSGADVVCLALGRSDTSSIGLSYVLGHPSVLHPYAAAVNPRHAFAVVQYARIAGTDVVAHELGHVFGCAHARGDPGTTGTEDGAYSYSYGYRFYGRDGRQYRDIMAYSPGTQLGYFSNPRVVAMPANAPIGVVAGQSDEADCALTIDQTAFEVASYRLQAAASSAGKLVNVSTRAHVGTRDEVLIAGFVIEGTQPKRVLVRAAGPALAGFGVANALANPTFSLHRAAAVVAENDDWSLQPNAAEIATVSAQAGAFSFGSGSQDAAALVTLDPGLYSAVVEGKGGETGSALVEVYDADRGTNRLINVSTRGYAAKGREMIGGFVVEGAAGTTKRILVRVLGPTLARAHGITGAMGDPMLDLHNSAGDLLIRNDDWSSGNEAGVFNPENDFKPAVKTYSEQQVARTGLAPSNRRESCVMVDLPPGGYSVVAQPFEDLSGPTPEPAVPGVAIVEVYEILSN